LARFGKPQKLSRFASVTFLDGVLLRQWMTKRASAVNNYEP